MENASVLEEVAEDTQRGKYLTFSVGREEYGIEICYVTEIIGIQEITEVPELPDYLKGIINLRGKIIPVMDVRVRFRLKAQEYNDRTCIVVVDVGELPVGLIVDRVLEVLTIEDADIVPPPDGKSGFQNRYVNNIGKTGKSVKLLLDCEKLIREDQEILLPA